MNAEDAVVIEGILSRVFGGPAVEALAVRLAQGVLAELGTEAAKGTLSELWQLKGYAETLGTFEAQQELAKAAPAGADAKALAVLAALPSWVEHASQVPRKKGDPQAVLLQAAKDFLVQKRLDDEAGGTGA